MLFSYYLMTNTYQWVIPTLSAEEGRNCVLRIRYNISSGDYDGWAFVDQMNGQMVDARYLLHNFDCSCSSSSTLIIENLYLIVIFWFYFFRFNDAQSPVRQDPNIQYGNFNYTLAMDTTQFGRTFQVLYLSIDNFIHAFMSFHTHNHNHNRIHSHLITLCCFSFLIEKNCC